MTRTLTAAQARRIALHAQGFNDPRPAGRVDARHLRRVLRRIGLIQIDSVNVLVRSHYMPLFSRLGPYPLRLLDDAAYRRRELFEAWAHAACFVPVEHYRLLRHRMEERGPPPRMQTVMEDRADYVDSILEEIRERGPLSISDLDEPGERSGPWWGWAPGKAVLEWHFAKGALAVSGRRNFARLYDLTERVLPPDVTSNGLPAAEAQRELMRLAARSLGVATAGDLANYYGLSATKARPTLDALVAAGELRDVNVEGWKQPAYLDPQATLPRQVHARALLTPFDSLIWRRERVERIFDFHYRIEIYVPRPQRRYGYYVLPFLLGDALVGRVDLKAERDAGTLRVRAAHIEDGRDPRYVARELAEELRSMAAWLDLDRVVVDRRGGLATALRAAID